MLRITATDLPRFMACNGSRLMGAGAPVGQEDRKARDEGNAADWLIEQAFKGINTVDELIDRKAPNGVFITPEMAEHVSEFVKDITGQGAVQQDTSFTSNKWEVPGRADHVSYKDKVLTVRDFKYGWGIVEPENNWTLLWHAIGFGLYLTHTQAINLINEVEKIVLMIYQPRPHHPSGRVRSWEITGKEMVELYAQLQKALENPTDKLNTGPNCYKCSHLATCPAAIKAGMNAIEVSESAFISDIDNTSLGFFLDQAERALKILQQTKDAYEDLALHRIKQGQIIENYALDNDFTNKLWKENVTAEMLKMFSGKDLTEPKLKTPSQAIKDGVSEILVDSLSERRMKGVKLVRMTANQKAMKYLQPKKK